MGSFEKDLVVTISGITVLGGFPWLKQLLKLNINFVSDEITDLSKIYNFFGSLSSILIIISCIFLPPNKVYFLAHPSLPIIIGFLVFLIHFWVYTIYKDFIFQNSKSFKGGIIITLHLITYLSIFSLFSMGISAVKYSINYDSIEGSVIEENTKKPLDDVIITLLDESDIGVYSEKTSNGGNFTIYVEKSKVSKIKKAIVTDNIHPNRDIIFNNQSEVLWKLEKIEMAAVNELVIE